MKQMNDWSAWHLAVPGTGLTLDLGEMGLGPEDVDTDAMGRALAGVARLEAGERVNTDEDRQVGHYWLRAPRLAPSADIRDAIEGSRARTREIARSLRAAVRPDAVLHLGIGGSALGPELLVQALPGDGFIAPERYFVLDNTDPESFERLLPRLDLGRAVTVVMSKSGRTPETRNALLRVQAAHAARGVPFAPRAVAVTGEGSELDRQVVREGWAGRLPLWDYVGGRTSVTGVVGLLPGALLGVDIEDLLDGAARMDEATRQPAARNPAAWMAAGWLAAQRGRSRAMVVLPYADRLRSLGRYLQQLVMESLGKRLDRAGREVRAGLTVYGNKGSTDQHAFIQQLRDGPDDFFACFVEVLRPSTPDPVIEDGRTAGDALAGFLLGTRQALADDGKRSLTVTLEEVTPRTLGAVIALFERAVSLYGELLGINAYHQPGVEAGKKAAEVALQAQARLEEALTTDPRTVLDLCSAARVDDPVLAWRLLRRLSANPARGVTRIAGDAPSTDRFGLVGQAPERA